MQRSTETKLARLNDTGIRVMRGQLTNLFGQPSGVARPPSQGTQPTKEVFSPEQSAAVFRLLNASKEENRKGNKLFQLLESLDVDQAHSWQSYENHYRKAKAPAVDHEIPTHERPWPGLLMPTATDRNCAHSIIEIDVRETNTNDPFAAADAGEATTFNDSRLDVAQNVYRLLGVTSKKTLEQLLSHESIAQAYLEYKHNVLVDQQRLAVEQLEQARPVHKAISGRSQHAWKIEAAIDAISTRSMRFIDPGHDKSAWTLDDHDLRFLVRTFLDAVTSEHPFNSLASQRRALVERALWLMLWFQWVHKPCGGLSKEAERVGRIKQFWLARLAVIESQHVHSVVQTATPSFHNANQDPPISPGPSERHLMHPPRGTTSCQRCSPPSGGRSTGIDTDHLIANLDPKREQTPQESSPKDGIKFAKWLQGNVHQTFMGQQRIRLGSYGVSALHAGTCLLVSEETANIDPVELLSEYSNDNVDLEQLFKRRLYATLAGHTTPWARAAAWFRTWPRTGSDLDTLVAVNEKGASVVHGSHLCHQAFCINPTHIILEAKEINIQRMCCMYGAIGIRSLGYPVPEHCSLHADNPCLLRLAALTRDESFRIQLSILGKALGYDPPPKPTPPKGHPAAFSTHEYKLPIQLDWPTVRVEQANLVMPPMTPSVTTEGFMEKHLVTCRFCLNTKRAWSSITAYWYHLRSSHSDLADEVLHEVSDSAEQYVTWAESSQQKLATQNPITYAKIEQTRADSWCWDVFARWRLRKT